MTIMLETSPERPVGLARPRPQQESSPPRHRSPKGSVFHSVDQLATSEAKSPKSVDFDVVDGDLKSPIKINNNINDHVRGRTSCSPPKIQIFNNIHPVPQAHAQTPYAMAPLLQSPFFYHPYLLMTSQLMTSQMNAMNMDKMKAQYASQAEQQIPQDLRKPELVEEPDACEERRLMKDCEDLMPTFCKTRTGKGHVCIYCGKLYSRKYGLKIHLRTHTGYKPLKCKVCQRPFGDPSNLNKHIRLHAQGETPYRCDQCGKVLVRRRDLERHIKSRHPGVKTTSFTNIDVKTDVIDDELKMDYLRSFDEDSDVESCQRQSVTSSHDDVDVDDGLDDIDVENE